MRFGVVKDPAQASGVESVDENKSMCEPVGSEGYAQLEALLGYTFADRVLLERALTHRSIQSTGSKHDYELLEFLGDAVFDLAVAHLLLEVHPEAHEGELSKMRAALVNTASLAAIAQELSLGRYIRLSRGEIASGGAERPSILADVLEALLGAVYREAGFSTALECIQRLMGESLLTVTPRDPKTELQEVLHVIGNDSAVYKLECVEGPEHSPVFISIVEVRGAVLGRGRGKTKKGSQQAAAEEALVVLKNQVAQRSSGPADLRDAQDTGGASGETSAENTQENSYDD